MVSFRTQSSNSTKLLEEILMVGYMGIYFTNIFVKQAELRTVCTAAN
jgi:hypothetical protein